MKATEELDILSRKFKDANTVEKQLRLAYLAYIFPTPNNSFDIIIQANAKKFMKMILDLEDNSNTDEIMVELIKEIMPEQTDEPSLLPRSKEIIGLEGKQKIQKLTKPRIPVSLKDVHTSTTTVNIFKRLVKLILARENHKIMTVNALDQENDNALDQLDQNETRIKMLGQSDRSKYRAILKGGKIYNPVYEVSLEDYDATKYTLFDTKNMESHKKKGYGSYVINMYGEISIFNHISMTNKIAHSSMNAGRAVFGAGEIKIEKGQLKELTLYSGHYKPSQENAYNVLKYLKGHGVDISGVIVKDDLSPKKDMYGCRRILLIDRACKIDKQYIPDDAIAMWQTLEGVKIYWKAADKEIVSKDLEDKFKSLIFKKKKEVFLERREILESIDKESINLLVNELAKIIKKENIKKLKMENISGIEDLSMEAIVDLMRCDETKKSIIENMEKIPVVGYEYAAKSAEDIIKWGDQLNKDRIRLKLSSRMAAVGYDPKTEEDEKVWAHDVK